MGKTQCLSWIQGRGLYLSASQMTLHGPSQTQLKVIRQFQGKLECEGKETIQSVYVVAHLKQNLLGLPAVKALNLAVRVESMSNSANCSVIDQFLSLFQGLGSSKLKDGATPFAVFTP